MVAKDSLIPLSASRVKTYKSCSWMYFSRYILKLPDKQNAGSLQGSCCHTIFENLLLPKHCGTYQKIMEHPSTIRNSPLIARYVRAYVKKHKLEAQAFNIIDAMIVTGLGYDFFCTKGGGQKLRGEQAFDIVNPEKTYRILGFIDKMACYPERKLLRVVDYKSSKKQFAGDDLEDNTQAKMYSLAARTLHPELAPIVEFIFLQFPNAPVQRMKFSKVELDEFEKFLESITSELEHFTEKDAVKNLAYRQPMPEEGFSGPLLCGRARSPDEKKKDGSPKWYCSCKFPFTYYALCNDDDEVIKTSMEDNLVPEKEKGQYVLKKHYSGCPAFNKKS